MSTVLRSTLSESNTSAVTTVKINSKDEQSSTSNNTESSTNVTDNSLMESTSSTSNSEEDSRVGNYILIKTIGDGKFSQIKLAKHLFFENYVAIKIYDKTLFTPDSIQTLYREIRIMKMLNHPNIVKLFETIDTENKLYMVLEYVPGGDLFDYINLHGKLNEIKARAVFRQIISAVEYCHQKNIIHRDIKEENILLDKEFNIKIADFGLSAEYSTQNKEKTFCGTLAYMAPEIYRGLEYGPEVDVWSLGVVLYSLVTRVLPFDGTTKQQIKKEVLRCSYTIPRYVSKSCRQVIRNMLVLNPAVRPDLETIMKLRWLNQGYKDNELKPYVEPNSESNPE